MFSRLALTAFATLRFDQTCYTKKRLRVDLQKLEADCTVIIAPVNLFHIVSPTTSAIWANGRGRSGGSMLLWYAGPGGRLHMVKLL